MRSLKHRVIWSAQTLGEKGYLFKNSLNFRLSFKSILWIFKSIVRMGEVPVVYLTCAARTGTHVLGVELVFLHVGDDFRGEPEGKDHKARQRHLQMRRVFTNNRWRGHNTSLLCKEGICKHGRGEGDQ